MLYFFIGHVRINEGDPVPTVWIRYGDSIPRRKLSPFYLSYLFRTYGLVIEHNWFFINLIHTFPNLDYFRDSICPGIFQNDNRNRQEKNGLVANRQFPSSVFDLKFSTINLSLPQTQFWAWKHELNFWGVLI